MSRVFLEAKKSFKLEAAINLSGITGEVLSIDWLFI
ncbi:MAG: hypothetical protein ACJA2Q_000198 [Pseudohongiellaceae bacterium]|jgi:hypothetical protein